MSNSLSHSNHKTKPQPRLVVIEQLYYQGVGQQPISIDSRFIKTIESEEQPFTRLFTVSTEWTPVPIGWLTYVSRICISNDEGKHLRHQLSTQDKVLLSKKILYIGTACYLCGMPGVVHTFSYLLPGEACQVQAFQVQDLRLKSETGEVPVTITALPL